LLLTSLNWKKKVVIFTFFPQVNELVGQQKNLQERTFMKEKLLLFLGGNQDH